MTDDRVRAAFRRQAQDCAVLGSPFIERLMRLAAERLNASTEVGARILGWRGDPSGAADSVPLRLGGALHALRLTGRALAEVYPPQTVPDEVLWAAVEKAFVSHREQILDWLGRAPQTNEVRRSAALIPVLHLLARRFGHAIDLIELGCSSGLNLRADRFTLEVNGTRLGSPGPVVLIPDWTGPPPRAGEMKIGRRDGIDLNPVDPLTDEGALRLLAYLWPDQTDRVERTRAAIGLSRTTPAQLHEGDAAGHLERLLARRCDGATTLVFHTIAWQYFPAETKQAAECALSRAGAKATRAAPLARFGMEADGKRGAALTLTTWPGTGPIQLGRADFHGRWIDWRGLPGGD